MRIFEYIPLAPKTTFRIGGTARYYCETETIVQLKEAIDFARTRGVPFFILGGGSNILFPDDMYQGLIIRIVFRGLSFEKNADGVFATVAAGETWDDFVAAAVQRGLWGVENLSAIPGSAGAAPVQNIGAYGQEVKETIEWVQALDTRSGELVRLKGNECRFGYRDSIFKKEDGKQFIIVATAFRLSPDGRPQKTYRGISQALEKEGILHPSPADMRRNIVALRFQKLPNVSEVGTAGSFFKNPVVSAHVARKLMRAYPALPIFPTEKEGDEKISAAWLVEHIAGMKGARRGDAGVFEKQAIVLVNTRAARASDILSLAEEIEKIILTRTGIKLEREVQVV